MILTNNRGSSQFFASSIGARRIGDTMKKLPAAQDLIDVGGYKLHLDCIGEGSPEDLLKLSPNSVFVSVDGATHSGLVDDERFVGETTEAILKIVENVRAGK
jgi:hypothetical protein